MAPGRKVTSNATVPLVRMGLQEQLVRRLALRILRRDLEPGDVLPAEDALASEFGVSRNVVREAIRALAAKGLVEGRARAGRGPGRARGGGWWGGGGGRARRCSRAPSGTCWTTSSSTGSTSSSTTP